MRPISIGILAVLALASSGQIVASEKSAVQEVKNALTQVTETAVKGDVVALDRLLADNFTRIQSDGMVLSKNQVLDGFKSGKIKFVVFDEADAHVHLYRDVELVTSTANTTMRSPDSKDITGQLRNSRVFVKRHGNWRIASFQSGKISKSKRVSRAIRDPPRR